MTTNTVNKSVLTRSITGFKLSNEEVKLEKGDLLFLGDNYNIFVYGGGVITDPNIKFLGVLMEKAPRYIKYAYRGVFPLSPFKNEKLASLFKETDKDSRVISYYMHYEDKEVVIDDRDTDGIRLLSIHPRYIPSSFGSDYIVSNCYIQLH